MATVELKLPRRTPRVPVVGVVAAAAALALAALWFVFSEDVAPDEFAVRQVYLGPNKGVQKQVYGPGWHLVVPGYERLHVFPRDIQVLDLNDDPPDRRAPADTLHAPAIRIQTSEGYQVTVDVTVLYRVTDPWTIVTKVGAGRIYENKIVARRADEILRQTLGRLDAEDFYDDKLRMRMAEDTHRELSSVLAEWGIQLWAVLLREYAYDERYQDAIEQRKIQDQKVFKNQAEALAAAQEAEKNRVLAEGQANIDVALERGRGEVRRIAAEADSYFRQKVAEGDLLVALAEAEGTRLENAALQQAGAANIVGLEMAEALKGTRVIVVPTSGEGGTNPLDLDALIRGW